MFFEPVTHLQLNMPGESVLYILQDKSTPILDSLVREAVQNSTDAVKDNVVNVNIDFSIGTFTSLLLSWKLDGISNELNRYYPNVQYNFLSISDSNTIGLIGNVNRDEIGSQDYFSKLVYGIGWNQEKEGAGGSWGLGKSIYYRLGIGIVIYYSRFENTDGNFIERMAVCLIEDHKKENALLRGKSNCGVAWWGKEGKDGYSEPITDSDQISNFLSIFGITPYQGNKTGTVIIIPYINTSALCPNNEENRACWWCSNCIDYMRMAIQKWYSPRILNPSFSRPYLVPSFNSVPLTLEDMEPFYRIIRDLYIYGTIDQNNEIDSLFFEGEIKKSKIMLNSVFKDKSNRIAGTLVFAEVSESDLLMFPPENHFSPHVLINNSCFQDEDDIQQIIVYTRGPGMILEYPSNSNWTCPVVLESKQNSYIVGIFIANSDQKLSDGSSLEYYLRSIEMANHSCWRDAEGYRIVKNIQGRVKSILKETFVKRNNEIIEAAPQELCNFLADLLLPGEDFGTLAKGKSKASTSDNEHSEININKKRSGSLGVILSDISEENNQIVLTFNFTLSSHNDQALLKTVIFVGDNRLGCSEWLEKTETKFPLHVLDCTINDFKIAGEKINNNDPRYIQKVIDKDNGVILLQGNLDASWNAKGAIKICSNDSKIGIAIELEE